MMLLSFVKLLLLVLTVLHVELVVIVVVGCFVVHVFGYDVRVDVGCYDDGVVVQLSMMLIMVFGILLLLSLISSLSSLGCYDVFVLTSWCLLWCC